MSASLRSRRLLMGLGLLLAVAIALWLVFGSERYVSTEDAYVKMDMASLSSRLGGVLVKVPVERNQWVEQGQLLAQIDPRLYQIAVAQAKAQLARVKNQLLADQANYRRVAAQLQQAERNVDFYRRELERNQKLRHVSVSESALDKSRHDLQQAKSAVAGLKAQLASLKAKLNGHLQGAVEQHPDYLAAQAALAKAEYDLINTEIRAPFAGQLGGSVPMVGKVVVSGLSLFQLAREHSQWIIANLKETAITHVKVGDSAVIEVDSYPDEEWQAQVVSLSPAAGSEFALIPPQNASGNWVKVVQRIPVVLRLLPDQEDKPMLRAGMSVTVTIDTATQADDASLAAAQPSGTDAQPAVEPSH